MTWLRRRSSQETLRRQIQLLRPIYENFEDKDATEDLKRSARLLNAAEANRAEYRMIERNLSK
jgi:hypothetical protein